MANEVVHVPDEVLALAAVENGPSIIEAELMAELCFLRAQDRQVFAFRVGDYLIVGPVPDAVTELAMIKLAEAGDTKTTKKMNAERRKDNTRKSSLGCARNSPTSNETATPPRGG